MFRPSERQKQIRLKMEWSDRRWLKRMGEARLIWLFATVILFAVDTREEPSLIFLPLAIYALAIYKHYFPTVSLHAESRAKQKPEGDQPEADEVLQGPFGELRVTEQRMLESMASLQAGGPALVTMAQKFAKTRGRLLHRKPRTRVNRERE